jgi:hypothetical protein
MVATGATSLLLGCASGKVGSGAGAGIAIEGSERPLWVELGRSLTIA